MRSFLVAAAAAILLAPPVAAQGLPPADSLPLSQIVANIEKTQPVRAFTELEWEDDGYWDIKFVDTSNRRTRVRIDPVSGEPWSRRR